MGKWAGGLDPLMSELAQMKVLLQQARPFHVERCSDPEFPAQDAATVHKDDAISVTTSSTQFQYDNLDLESRALDTGSHASTGLVTFHTPVLLHLPLSPLPHLAPRVRGLDRPLMIKCQTK